MRYVIVDKDTKCKVRQSYKHTEYFASEGMAKAGLRRYAKARNVPEESLEVMDTDQYKKQVPMKRVKVLNSDKWIEIPADTPASCDPSTETYWSM